MSDRSLEDKNYPSVKVDKDSPYYNEIIKRHDEAIGKNDDVYIDPESGFTVLTAEFLLRRGYCCESGCRHCPYN